MMKQILRKTRNSLGYLTGLIVAVALGGATTALVMAAIPDTSGVIHGCRSNISGGLRVIDSAGQQCLTAETGLNWNQTGPQGPQGQAGSSFQVASVFITYNPDTHSSTLDSNRSNGITNFVDVPGEYICMQTDFIPKLVLSSNEQVTTPAIKDENGWTSPQGEAYCGNISNTNVFLMVPNTNFFVFIH